MIAALFTAGKLGLAAYQGVEELTAATIRFGIKLAVHSHAANQAAADEMVDLMRERVPVDKGRLLNGITAEEDGDAIVVQASAIRGDFDYARAVEFGHDVGHGDPLGPPRSRRSRALHDNHADAEPFFVESVRDVLEERGISMEDAIGDAAAEAGL